MRGSRFWLAVSLLGLAAPGCAQVLGLDHQGADGSDAGLPDTAAYDSAVDSAAGQDSAEAGADAAGADSGDATGGDAVSDGSDATADGAGFDASPDSNSDAPAPDGAPDDASEGGLVCVGGTTVCAADGGESFCADTQGDSNNCGGCGTVCAAPLKCAMGSCVVAEPTLSLLAGQLGSSGNLNGTMTASRFNGPWGVAWSGGNLYVADTVNCVIRKIELPSGTTSTFVGAMGACGYTDAVGPAARFNSPVSVAADGQGNLFVTDRVNCAVRQIVIQSLSVTTLAGGAGCGYADGTGGAAKFGTTPNSPPNPVPFGTLEGIVYDGIASVYVADTANHAIRRIAVTPTPGVVTTVAGAPPPMAATAGNVDNAMGANARFNFPAGLAVDKANNLYVADSANNSVRMITLAAPFAVTTIAKSLSTPMGAAFDGVSNLFVTENGAHDVLQIALQAGYPVTKSTGVTNIGNYADGSLNAALFNNPRGIAFDNAGNYYVGDFGNHAIRQVTAATGSVVTLAGLGASHGAGDGTGSAATFNQPWGLAFDGVRTLYVSDYSNSTLRTVDIITGQVVTIAGTAGATGNVDATGPGARFNSPAGLALDGSGHLYVADRSNNTIRKVVLATAAVTTVFGTAGQAGSMDNTGTSILFNQPLELALDGQGNLFVADYANRTIRQIVLSTGMSSTPAGSVGSSSVVDGTGAGAHFSNVTGIAADMSGVYVADTNRLRMLTPSTGQVVTLTGSGGFSDGQGTAADFNFNNNAAQLTFDGAGNLYLSDFTNTLIREFSTTSLSATTIGGVFGSAGGVPGILPTSIPSSPRAAVPIPGGYAFIANNGIFVVR